MYRAMHKCIHTHLFTWWVTASGLLWSVLETDTSPFLLLPLSRFLHVLVSTLSYWSFLWVWEPSTCASIWNTNGNESVVLSRYLAGVYKSLTKIWIKNFTTEVLWLFSQFSLVLHLKIMFQELSEKLSSLLKHLLLFPLNMFAWRKAIFYHFWAIKKKKWKWRVYLILIALFLQLAISPRIFQWENMPFLKISV